MKSNVSRFLLYLLSICILEVSCQVFTSQEKTDILNAHNSARAAVDPPAVNMGTMVWNTTLESWAQSWVDGCQNTDSNTAILDHSPSSHRPGAGENIFASTGTALGPDAVNSWNSEKQYYVYSTNYCSGQLYTATSPVWGNCGHYTQIAWASSVQLGCARGYCSNIQYGYTIVCNYSPPGNYYGGSNNEFYRPYATAAPGSSPSVTPSRTPSPGTSTSSSSSTTGTTPDDTSSPNGDKNGGKKSNTGAVAGGIVAAVGVVALGGAAAAFFIYRRKKNAYKPTYYNNANSSASTSSSPSPAVSTSPSNAQTSPKPVVVMSTPSAIQQSFMSQAPEGSQPGYKPPVNSNPKPPIPSQPVPKPPVNNSNPFPVGSNCMAKYTGDGQYYKAVVKQYNPSQGYLVSYPGYGSEEWLPLSSLKK